MALTPAEKQKAYRARRKAEISSAAVEKQKAYRERRKAPVYHDTQNVPGSLFGNAEDQKASEDFNSAPRIKATEGTHATQNVPGGVFGSATPADPVYVQWGESHDKDTIAVPITLHTERRLPPDFSNLVKAIDALYEARMIGTAARNRLLIEITKAL